MKSNLELRQAARNALAGQWVMAALVAFVYSVISGASGSLVIAYIVVLPIVYGFSILYLKTLRGEDVNIGALFDGFQDYGRILGTILLQIVYTFLWTLLLVIPGIVKGYSYAMTHYLLLDEPELKNDAAIEKSMAMMKGYKMKLFLLDLSFIGWGLLSLFTFGIGIFFLQAYMSTAHAAFYEELKGRASVVV